MKNFRKWVLVAILAIFGIIIGFMACDKDNGNNDPTLHEYGKLDNVIPIYRSGNVTEEKMATALAKIQTAYTDGITAGNFEADFQIIIKSIHVTLGTDIVKNGNIIEYGCDTIEAYPGTAFAMIAMGEAMRLIPHRQLYNIDDKFMRDKDFKLFVVEKGGRVAEVLPDPTFPDAGAKVSITGNIDLSTEFTEIMTSEYHSLHQIGKHKITVSFANKSSYYIIEVFSPNNGNTLGGDDGNGIIFLD